MKIAIDARIMDKSSGIGRYIYHLLSELQRLDNKNQYVVLLRKQNFNLWEPEAPNFTKLLADYRHFSIREQIHFCLFLYRLRPGLVHFTNVNHPVLYFRKRILNVHDLTLVDYKNVRNSKLAYTIKYWAFRFVLRHGIYTSSAVITISSYVRKRILSRYKVRPRRFTLTYPSVNKPSIKTTPYKPMINKKFIFYVGSAYPFKNLERLIEAFAKLQASHPDLLLLLVGKQDDFYKALMKKTTAKNTNQIVFTGYVPDKQLEWLYAHATAYVFPSMSEGFGLPGLEAMAHGLPVVSSSATCLPEVYGKAAHFFNPTSTDDMSKKIAEVVDNQTLRNNLIMRGYAQVKKFSWSKMAEQTLEIYNKVL